MSPTFLSFHTQYWEFSDTSVTPIIPSQGGYPVWQSSPHSVTIGASLFGIPPDVPDLLARWWAAIAGGIAFLVLMVWTVKRFPRRERERLLEAVKDLTALDAERLAVVERTINILRTPIYEVASQGVRQTATTLGFNKPQAWIQLSHKIKDHHGWAENSWRHLHACELTDRAAREQGSTLTNRDRHFAVALAYEGFVANPRTKVLQPLA